MTTPIPLGEVRRLRLLWLGRLGDVLLSTPLLAGLRSRFPKARIELVTGERGAAAAKLCADIDGFRVLRNVLSPLANLSLALELVRGKDDLLVDLNTAFSRSSCALAALSRAPAKLAFSRGRGDGLYSHLLPAATENEHMLDRYGRLAAALGAPYEPRLRVKISPADMEAAKAALSALGLPPGRRVALVHPGNFKKFDNRWPEDKFAALTEGLYERGLAVVYLSGPGEEAEVRGVVARLSRPAPVLGPLPIGVCAAALSLVDLVAANATGTSHLSVAVGTPTVCVLSRYTQTVWMPRPGAAPFFSAVSDSWESCRDVPVEAALAALDRALQSLPRR